MASIFVFVLCKIVIYHQFILINIHSLSHSQSLASETLKKNFKRASILFLKNQYTYFKNRRSLNKKTPYIFYFYDIRSITF